MKRKTKITMWTVAAAVLLLGGTWGGFCLWEYLYERSHPIFEQTRVFPNDGDCPADTTFNVNGIDVKMIGVKGGKVCWKGIRDTIVLDDFFIGETEVTQELWVSVMGYNPSAHKDSALCPVENIDLVDCFRFVHRLDSISGIDFRIQTYFQWIHAAHLGNGNADYLYCGGDILDSLGWYEGNAGNRSHPVKQKRPNALGIYDMTGNVSEWTMSGSDPLFLVVGGGYNSGKEGCEMGREEFDFATITSAAMGLRLVYIPKK